MKIELTAETLSPLHLSSGQADVNIDADVIHDRYGLPYFPGRRFKGLLYESAVEVAEMMERAGLSLPVTPGALFRHEDAMVQLVIPNLCLGGTAAYEEARAAWDYLQKAYPSLVRPSDVLGAYTSVRYQTCLTDGVAKKGSLHNMRVVEAGVTFSGTGALAGDGAADCLPLLAAAIRNLRACGLKHNRGFGKLRCHLRLEDGRMEDDLLKGVL